MKLLAIETSTEACSVAVLIDGRIRERFEIASRRHTELVLPWADELLAEAGIGKAQLDAIAVGCGPGAFTGVRLAISLAQGMALALDIPVVPVSTLAVLALQAVAGNAVGILAAIDARMGEVYLGAFAPDAANLLRPLRPEWMARPNSPELSSNERSLDDRWLGVGTGFAAGNRALPEALGSSLLDYDATALPRAADLARLAVLAFERGEAIAPEQVEPAYLRDKVALTLAEQHAARA
jgi:tRNA threonylcarbamoyladenosine biosynthesis protein TsaB